MCTQTRKRSAVPELLVIGVAALGFAAASGHLHNPFTSSAPARPPAPVNVSQVEAQAAAQNARLSVEQHQVQLQQAQTAATWSGRLTMATALAEMSMLVAGSVFALAAALWTAVRIRAHYFGGPRLATSRRRGQLAIEAPRLLELPAHMPPPSPAEAVISVAASRERDR
jgi:hypothetical protein